MRTLRAFAIALITAVVGMFLAVFASDYLTRIYHVSDMEGQRGMAVIFLFAPLGFIVGFVVGLITALRTRWPGFVGFVKGQGLSLLITTAIAAVVSGLVWLGADHPPKIDGKELTLDFELRIPSTIQLPPELNEYSIHASLFASRRDHRAGRIDIHSIGKRADFTIVPGTAPLMSRSANRSLLLSIGNTSGPAQMINLNLPPSPRREKETWSDWIVATQYADLKPVPEPERMSVRYRVRVAD
jgi:hypothetical protein